MGSDIWRSLNISQLARLILIAGDAACRQFFHIALLMVLQISRKVDDMIIRCDGRVLRFSASISDSNANSESLGKSKIVKFELVS